MVLAQSLDTTLVAAECAATRIALVVGALGHAVIFTMSSPDVATTLFFLRSCPPSAWRSTTFST